MFFSRRGFLNVGFESEGVGDAVVGGGGGGDVDIGVDIGFGFGMGGFERGSVEEC